MTELEFSFDDFMSFCYSKNLSIKTTKSYDQLLKFFIHYLKSEFDITSPKEGRAAHVREYAKYLKERGKYTVVANEVSRTKPFQKIVLI